MSLTDAQESGGHIFNNIFYVTTNEDPLVVSDGNTIASGVAAAWNTDIAPVTTGDISLTQVIVHDIGGSEVQGSWVGTHAGTHGTAPMPASISACVSWGIPVAYRGGHPRTYMPGVSQNDLVSAGSNLLTVAAAGNIATAWGNFATAVNALTSGGATILMGTVSYYRAKALRVTPVFYTYSEIPRVNTRLATQRRRLGKLSAGAYEV